MRGLSVGMSVGGAFIPGTPSQYNTIFRVLSTPPQWGVNLKHVCIYICFRCHLEHRDCVETVSVRPQHGSRGAWC